MRFLLIPIVMVIGFQSTYAAQVDPMFIGKWADSKPSCRGIVNNDAHSVLTIKNSATNQIRDQRYEGYHYINLIKVIQSPRNELQAIAMNYSFSDEEPEEIYKEKIKIDYTIIKNKLYSINRYISEDGKEESYTLTYIKCN